MYKEATMFDALMPLLIVIAFGLIAWLFRKEICQIIRPRHFRRYRWPLEIKFNKIKIKAEIMEFTLHEDEVLPFRLGKPINSQGEEAEIEAGSLKEIVVDPAIFTVEQDDENPNDPDAKMFVAQGEGSTEYKVTADADLGEGVEEITLNVTGTVINAGAIGFAPVLFGTPRKKKTPPPPAG